MLFEILRILTVLAIAIPFVYIVLDVAVDLSRRVVRFLRFDARPVLVRIRKREPFQR